MPNFFNLIFSYYLRKRQKINFLKNKSNRILVRLRKKQHRILFYSFFKRRWGRIRFCFTHFRNILVNLFLFGNNLLSYYLLKTRLIKKFKFIKKRFFLFLLFRFPLKPIKKYKYYYSKRR